MTIARKEVRFTKMHGAGNDYIYLDATGEMPEDLPELSRRMSDPHFGVGSDGLVAVMTSDIADFRMRMFNSDGSEAEMCGNASRCIAKFVYEKGLTDSETVTLETLAGIKVLHLHVREGVVESVTVDMGAPVLEPASVPVLARESVPAFQVLSVPESARALVPASVPESVQAVSSAVSVPVLSDLSISAQG